MSRPKSSEPPAPRAQNNHSSPSPSPRRPATDPVGDAPVVFPFARTAEDDDLRDMTGYGWGV